jgi:rhamnose transport system ATP-binding protein
MENGQLLEIVHVSKRFGGVAALNDVSLSVLQGECHAVVGENGAGKTTLINILNGALRPDSGHFYFRGQQFAHLDPVTSILQGINVIHQELALVDSLTVMENIFLPNLAGKNRFFRKSKKELRQETQKLLDMLGCDIDPQDLIENLSSSQKQLVEIAKALSSNAQLIIMDEPTAALTQSETSKLFDIINSLKERGISVIFVSHRLDEVMRIADRITIIRDGRYVGTVTTAETTVDTVIRMMVGRELELYQKLRTEDRRQETVLRVIGLSKLPYFQDVSFEVKSGEILCLSGLVGSGRTELAQTIFGFMKPDSGRLEFHGREHPIQSPMKSIAVGVGLLPEDRKISSTIDTMSVRENMSVVVLPRLRRTLFVDKAEEKRLVRKFVDLLRIKVADVEHPISSLSGGNQQKVMLARWLATRVSVLIVDEPTQGVDVGAKAEIHKLLRNLVEDGVAVVVISSDLPEVLSISDRVLVMRAGKVEGELTSAECTEEAIISLATLGAGAGQATGFRENG